MAAINEIEISTEQLSHDISALRSRLAETRQHISRLESTMRELNAAWEGPAKAEEMNQFNADRNNLLDVCRMLDALLANLERIQRLYVSCDTEVGGVIDRLSV